MLDGAVRDVCIYGTQRHGLTLSRALTTTRSRLFADGDDDVASDADEMILRAALELILDDALMLLEEPPMHSEETEGLGTDNTKLRSIER